MFTAFLCHSHRMCCFLRRSECVFCVSHVEFKEFVDQITKQQSNMGNSIVVDSIASVWIRTRARNVTTELDGVECGAAPPQIDWRHQIRDGFYEHELIHDSHVCREIRFSPKKKRRERRRIVDCYRWRRPSSVTLRRLTQRKRRKPNESELDDRQKVRKCRNYS